MYVYYIAKQASAVLCPQFRLTLELSTFIRWQCAVSESS